MAFGLNAIFYMSNFKFHFAQLVLFAFTNPYAPIHSMHPLFSYAPIHSLNAATLSWLMIISSAMTGSTSSNSLLLG